MFCRQCFFEGIQSGTSDCPKCGSADLDSEDVSQTPRANDNSVESPHPATTLTALKRKLHPSRFSRMSKTMAGIVGYVLDETYSSESFRSLEVTSDGHVEGMPETSFEYRLVLGTYIDVERSWRRLLQVAELTPEERTVANRLFAQALRPTPSATAINGTESQTINKPGSNLTHRDEQLLKKLHVQWR